MSLKALRYSPPRTAIAVLLVTSFAGCHAWAEVPPPYAPWIEESECEVIRIVSDGTEMELRDPDVTGDFLHGQDAIQAIRIAVPISSISRVQTRHVDGMRTSGALSVGAVSAAVLLGLLAAGAAAPGAS
jgi:hypothetical protein